MTRKKLRDVEKRVLCGLELDARMPFSRLGRRIRKSQQQVSYTANSLVEKGVIKGFYAVVDYSKLDVLKFRVYFKVSYINKEKYDELIGYLVSRPYTSWVATCGGRYDLICAFFATNPSQFNKKLRAIMAKFPRQLQNYTVLTTIVNRKFSRKYLSRNPSAVPEIVFGGDREPEDVDDIDMRILDELSDNGRKSCVDISSKLSITPKTVIERIRRLRRKEMLLGFKPLVNPRSMGYIPVLLMIRYHNITPELEKELIGYLKRHPSVTWVVKTLGNWDIEISIEGKDTMELRNIEMEIRQKFVTLIQEVETIPIYTTYKKNLFPRFLLESG